MSEHGLILVPLEEALTDVALLKPRDVGPEEEPSPLTGQTEGPTEGG